MDPRSPYARALVKLPPRYGPELEVLGQGGFATVYKARDELTGRDVAIKIPFRGANSDLARDLAAELRAMATLRHPNVIQVLDTGTTDDGAPFLAMEFAPDGSMASLFDALPPAWSDLLPLVDGVLCGLGHAHARGLIHRDIKPENILLDRTPAGRPVARLTDFGLAKVLDRQGAWNSTRMGAGTLAYMAPEQFGTDVSAIHPSADLYAFGVLLFGLVAGQLPWSGERVVSILYAKVDADPPVLLPRPGYDIPAGLAAIVRRLIDRRPSRRYQLAADVRRDLAALDLSRVEGFEGPARADESFDCTDPRHPEAPALPSQPPTSPALLHTPPCAAVAAVRPPLFVDREPLRTALWSMAIEGSREAKGLALVGPTGIGRSRLCQWLYSALEESGCARPLHLGLAGGTSPTEALTRELRRVLGLGRLRGTDLRDRVEESLETLAPADRPHLETLCLWLDPAAASLGARAVADAAEFTDAAVRLIRAESRRGLGFVWIEEEEGSDRGLGLAEMLLREARAERFPLLILYDAVEDAARCPAGFHPLEVGPLEGSAARALLRDMLPAESGLVQDLARRAKGVPALLVELARLTARASRVADRASEPGSSAPLETDSSAPTVSIRDVARARLEAFLHSRRAAGASELLVSLLALLPRPVAMDVVERAMEAAGGQGGPTVSVLLDEARAAGILRSGPGDRIDFESPALAEAARQLLPGDRLSHLRRSCAEGILGGEAVAADRARAGALLLAAGEPRAALDLLLSAGDDLLRIDLDAARHALQAAVGAAHAAGLPASDPGAYRARLGLARAQRNSGALVEALATLAVTAGGLSDMDRGELLSTRASVLLLRGELEKAGAHAQSALAALEGSPDAVALARATRILGEADFRRGLVSEAESAFQRSLAYATEADSAGDELAAQWRLARVHRVRGEASLARLGFEAVLAKARSLGDVRVEGISLRELGNLALAAGDREAALALLQDSIERLERAGQRAEAIGTRVSLGELARASNQLQDARREYSAALAAARAYGLSHTTVVVLLDLAMTELALHKTARAARRIEAVDELVPPGAPHRHRAYIEAARLAVLCGRGDPDGAEEVLDRLLELELPPDPDMLFLLERSGDLSGRNGEVALATDIFELALDVAGACDDAEAAGRIRQRMGTLVGA